MADETRRRPLPALVSLLALALLTSLVWWRVLHRGTDHSAASTPCPPAATASSLPRPGTVTVSVLNSTQRAGIAKSTADALTQRGFTVSGFGNDTGHVVIPGTAEIRFAHGSDSAAKLLSFYFPGATLVPETAPTPALVVSLGAKFTAVAAQPAVDAAIAAAHLTQTPATRAAASPGPSPSC